MGALLKHWAIPPIAGSMVALGLAEQCAAKVRVRLGEPAPMVAVQGDSKMRTAFECGHGRFDRYICVFMAVGEDEKVSSAAVNYSVEGGELAEVITYPNNTSGSVLVFSERLAWERIVAPCLQLYEEYTGVALTGRRRADYPGPEVAR
jgi:hypothetical protein